MDGHAIQWDRLYGREASLGRKIQSPAGSGMPGRHSNGQERFIVGQTGREPSGKVWIVDTNFGVLGVWRTIEAMGVGETA